MIVLEYCMTCQTVRHPYSGDNRCPVCRAPLTRFVPEQRDVEDCGEQKKRPSTTQEYVAQAVDEARSLVASALVQSVRKLNSTALVRHLSDAFCILSGANTELSFMRQGDGSNEGPAF